MRILDAVRFRIVALFKHSKLTAEMEEELQEHIRLRAEDLERSGVARAEAERRARIEFGGVVRFQEESREAAGGTLLESLWTDLRLALRVLRKAPSFSLVAVVALALGIGANAVVFGVLNALVIRPLSVPQAETLWGLGRGPDRAVNQSFPDYRDLRDRNRSFEDLAAYNVTNVGLDTGNNPTPAWILETTGNYFDALHVQPYIGRFFHAADERGPNSAPYIVLSYAYWRSHFQEDRNVVGRTVQLNKHPFTIIGVAPQEFRGTLVIVAPDFWVPIVNQEQVEGINVLEVRSNRGILMVLGHLKAGVTPAQAVEDLNSVGAYLEKTYPIDDGQMTFSLTRPGLAGDWLGDPLRAFLTALMLLAGLILIAACANVGSLFAAHTADRAREIALRLALGSSAGRVLRQLFTESVLISLAGGALGLWGSVALLHGLSVWQPFPAAPLVIPVNADAKVYVVALLLSLVSGFLFGIVPVRQVLRTDPYQVIKSGPVATVGRRITLRDVLLTGQVAICALLVTASLVAVRGMMRSVHSNLGFDPHGALLVETSLGMGGYIGDNIPVMQKRMIEAVEKIPGVQAAGSADRLPLYYGANSTTVFRDDASDLRPTNAAATAMLYHISPGYFDAARTSLLAGRPLSWHDDKNAPRVAVVNRQLASKVFGSANNAIGNYFKLRTGVRVQVVGMVEDGKYGSLAENQQAAVFYPLQQMPAGDMGLVVRAKGDPQQVADAVRNAIKELDPGLPFSIHTWTQELESALFPARMATMSLGVLGALGAVLSVTGIFGMAAYSVSKRLRELGIRMALGAQGKEILQTALGRALKLLAIGSIAGLLLGVLASRVLASIVYQATPRDPLVLGGVMVAMIVLGLAATWIPAQRALSVNPVILLREE